MQDFPPLAGNSSQDRRDRDLKPNQTHDTGISLWIAAATVVISLGVMLIFTQGHLKNGGAPFVITPSTQISSYPAADR